MVELEDGGLLFCLVCVRDGLLLAADGGGGGGDRSRDGALTAATCHGGGSHGQHAQEWERHAGSELVFTQNAKFLKYGRTAAYTAVPKCCVTSSCRHLVGNMIGTVAWLQWGGAEGGG